MTRAVMNTYAEFQDDARGRWDRRHAGKTRVAVQVGHCSQAVGAREVAEALRDALGNNAAIYLVVAGCDGACFNASPGSCCTPVR